MSLKAVILHPEILFNKKKHDCPEMGSYYLLNKKNMKKNLFYLFALICSMSLFTACSDDDDDTWKQIPQTEITGSDAALTVNGETSSTGSVQMTVKNESEAVLTLKDVIVGYSEIAVDVELQKQADNSFLFAGEMGLSTPPSMMSSTKAAASEAVFNLAVSGNITVAGKVSVTTTTELTTAAQGGLTGSWKLGDFAADENLSIVASPAFIKWQASEKSQMAASTISTMVTMMGSSLLAEFLNEVTFNADGNITAKYGDKLPPVEELGGELTVLDWMINTPNITDDWSIVPLNTTWKASPKNLAFWYVKDGLLYVVPNINNIMNQVTAGQGGSAAGSLDMDAILQKLGELGIDLNDPNVQVLLQQVVGWISTGIPLKYSVTDGGLVSIYVDKTMVEPFMKVILGLLPALDHLVPEEYAGLLQMFLGISKPSDLSNVWNDTTGFDLGLDLKK